MKVTAIISLLLCFAFVFSLALTGCKDKKELEIEDDSRSDLISSDEHGNSHLDPVVPPVGDGNGDEIEDSSKPASGSQNSQGSKPGTPNTPPSSSSNKKPSNSSSDKEEIKPSSSNTQSTNSNTVTSNPTPSSSTPASSSSSQKPTSSKNQGISVSRPSGSIDIIV